MLGLEPQQLPNQQVEIGVGDLGAVEGVVPLVVIGDLLPKVCDPGGDVGLLRHACECKQLRAE